MDRYGKEPRILACICLAFIVFALGAVTGKTAGAEENPAPAVLKRLPEIFVQMGHTDRVTSVAFSPDGNYALSGSWDNTLRLWQVSSGREIRRFQGHTDGVNSVAFSPDGRYALSGSAFHDKTVRLWEVSTGKELRSFSGHTDAVYSVAFSPDGRFALSGSADNTLKLWEVSSGSVIKTFQGHTAAVTSVAFSPDGRYVLSGAYDRTVMLWEVSNGSVIKTFQGHSDTVLSVAFSPDGLYALSGGYDNTAKLWEIASGREIRAFPGHTAAITSVAFSPNGRYVLAGSDDQTMKLWEVSSGQELRTQALEYRVVSVTFSPDGRYYLSGSSGGTMKLWKVSDGSVIRKFQGDANPVQSVAVSPDGRYALSGTRDTTLKLWDLSNGRQLRTFQGHTARVLSAAFSPDGQYALSGSADETIKLWEVSSGREIRTFQDSSWVTSVAFSPDGSHVLSGGFDQILKLWEVSSGQELNRFKKRHTYGISSVAFSPDGRYALSGCGDGTMRLWDVSSGREKRTFKAHTATVSSVAFSPDGRFALSGGKYTEVMKLWDLESGREIRTFEGAGAEVLSVSFSPDGRYALSGSVDNTMRLWEVSSGREIRAFRGVASNVTSVTFSPDGSHVLSGSASGATTIWEVATGKEIAQMVGFPDGEWVVITPEGYFDSSGSGAKHLNVSIGNNVYGIDQFYSRFYRPELVQLALSGKRLPEGESLGEVLAGKSAPTVEIVSPVTGGSFDKESVTVSLKIVDNGGGIGDANVYLNGSQVANDARGLIVRGRESAGEKTISFTIVLMDGVNEIKAVVFNKEGSMESNPATVTVTSKAVLAKPNLYALVVGINEYKNKSISLNNAVSDAKAFAETVQAAAEPLFDRMEVQVLSTPDETSRDAITKAFEVLRAKVKPNDLFVFYDASHGVVDVVDDEEQYFLITSNVLLLSSRHIGTDAISQKELGRLIGSIPAQKKVVFLDTCNAGRGGKGIQVALLQQTRGLTDSTAVKVLQRTIGSAVFAASSDTQQALEGYQGHGLFTYVLMEGLKGKADLKKDGFITVLGLADYVEEEVLRLSESVFKRQQSPTIQTGANFPLGKVR